MTYSDAVTEALLRHAAAVLAAPRRVLALQVARYLLRYPIVVLEVTADPGAWYIEVETPVMLAAGVYPAVIEHGDERTPGIYTVVAMRLAAGKDASGQGLQGIFRPA